MTREELDDLLVELSGAHTEWDTRLKLLAEYDRVTARAESAEAERDKYKAALKAIAIGMLMPKEFAKAALDGRWKPIFEKGVQNDK